MDVTPQNEKEKRKVVPLFRSGDYFFHLGIEAYRKQHLHRAVTLFERAVRIKKQEPVFQIQLAVVLTEIGNYERSNDILQQVLIEHGDQLPECYFFMANNYAYLGMLEQAERHASRYLHLSPEERFKEDAKDLIELLKAEREEEEDWSELDEQEDQLISRHERASFLLKNGEIELSLPILESIIEDFPTYWAAHNHLAEALFRLGDEAAFNKCDQILEEDPGNLFAICNLALFYTKTGQHKEAESLIESLKRVYPLDVDHYMKVAETLCAVGEFKVAYDRLRFFGKHELELRPNLLCCFGVASINIGEEKKGRSLVNKAKKLGSKQANRLLMKMDQHEAKTGALTYDLWCE